jgi:beta-N-acetylhexosaminidase
MRVVAFKEQQGMLSSSNAQINVSVSEKDKNEFQALAQQVTQNAIVIKRNRKKTLPISTQQTKRIAHLILEVSNGNQLDKLQQFTAKLQNKFENVVEWMDMGANQIFQKVQNKEVDMVICSISAPYRFGTNVTRFHGVVARNLMKGWMKLDTPVVFISHDSATFAEEYRQFDTIISTHGLTDTSIEELIPIITK